MTGTTKDYSKLFPELDQFFSGYFHQDWKDDYDWGSQEHLFEQVVRHYKTEDSQAGISKTVEELTLFLELNLTDEKIHRIVEEEFSSWYTPRSRGMNKRQFLEKVLEVLKEPIETAQTLKRIA